MLYLFLYSFNLLLYSNPFEDAEKLVLSGKYAQAIEIILPLAQKNDPKALNILGWLYMEGKGVQKDEVKAFNMYKTSADNGFVKAYYNTGVCYKYGRGTELNIPLAVEYYKKGAEKNESKSLFVLGRLYYRGCKIERDIDKGIDYLIKGCNKGLERSCYELGMIYQNDIKNYKKAVKYYKKAGGNTGFDGYTAIGNMYFYGLGDSFKKNIKKAIKYYKKSSHSNNNAHSLYQLGFIHFIRPDLINNLDAFNYLTLSSQSGYEKSYGLLGILYLTSKEVGIDIEKGKKYIEIAEKNNDIYSISLVSKLCELNNIPCDTKERERWNNILNKAENNN